ncbi:MAG TPA: hypothetical protein VME44_14025 [Streptosporangiaceae bacterium]|nr:hypothetical protein [Streptosporangiaceae bacterium]
MDKKARARTTSEQRALKLVRIAGMYAVAAAVVGAATSAVLTSFFGLLSSSPQDASAGTQTARTGGPPVAVVSVSLQRNGAYQGETFIFQNKLNLTNLQLADLNRSNSELGQSAFYDSWARAHGGVDPGTVIIQLILAGNRSYPVRIVNMNPVGTCTAPLDGTILDSPPAGEDDSALIGFNLDSPDPVAETYSEAQGFGQSYFEAKTVTLQYPQQQVFEIVGVTAHHFCQFRIQLTVLEAHKTVRETIGNGSRPFIVSGGLPLTDYKEVYIGGVMTVQCPGAPGGFIRINARRYKFGVPCSAYVYR